MREMDFRGKQERRNFTANNGGLLTAIETLCDRIRHCAPYVDGRSVVLRMSNEFTVLSPVQYRNECHANAQD